MTPVALAAVHATAFDRPWDAAAFQTLLGQPGVAALGDDDGFVLIRAVAGEAEILTLAVLPERRGQGLGLTLTRAAADLARTMQATVLHLEVAEDNVPALSVYRRAGFIQSGRRPGYYPRQNAPDAAALILNLNLD